MNKILKQIIWLIIAIPLVYLAFVWKNIPQTVAIHYNLQGIPDRFGSKNELLITALIVSIVNAGVYLLLLNIHRIDPKKSAAENKPRLKRMGFAISVFITALLCFIIYTSMHPDARFSTRIIFAGVGLLLCFIGNYIHNIKPNYFAGLRLPWTLENEDNWRKTHLLAGKLFFAGGLLITIVCLFTSQTVSIIAFFSITVLLIIIPCVYSYRLYKQQKMIAK